MLTFPPDWTFIAQIILFLVLWTILRRLLFEPNLAVLETREQRSVGTLKEASQIKAEAEAVGEQYTRRLAEARVGAMQQVDTVYREAEEQAQALIEAARVESAQIVTHLRATLTKETAEARHELEGRVPDFAREIVEKLLGRPLT